MKYDIDSSAPKQPRKGTSSPAIVRRPRSWDEYIHACAKDSPSPPRAPDPYATANAQTQSNIQTAAANAALNRVNWNTPWGSLTYSQSGGTGGFVQPRGDIQHVDGNGFDTGEGDLTGVTSMGGGASGGSGGTGGSIGNFGTPGQWTGNITLSPAQQALLDQQNSAAGWMGDTLNNAAMYSHGMLSHDLDIGGTRATNVTPGAMTTGVNAGDLVNNASYGTGPRTDIPNQGSLTNNVNYGSIDTQGPQSRAVNDGTGINRQGVTFNGPAAGDLQYGVQGAGAGIQSSGPAAGSFVTNAGYGNIQNDANLQGVQGVQGQVNTSGVPGLVGGDALNADLQQQRDALYKAQAGYLDPQWAAQQHDLQVQLANQGVMQNSEAWNRAMDDFNRQRTFAYNQAQQSAITGGGAEQSRLFGLGLAANQNAFGQAVQKGTFANTAQQQQFNEAGQLQNWHNQAQQQGFGQSLSNAQLANAASAEGFNERARGMELANAAQQQGFSQNFANAQLNNATQGQAFSQGMQGMAAHNAAQAQDFGQQINLAELQNQAGQQGFNQDLAGMQARNAAQAQGFGQQFQNAQLNNTAEGQAYTQGLQGLAAYNQAQQQGFNQNMANANLANSAQSQQFQQGLSNADLANQAQSTQFNQGMSNANLENTARQTWINEQISQRNQAVNEMNALRTGSQVTAPNFPTAPQVNMPGTNISGLIEQNYANQMGAYNSQVSQNNALTGGLFSLGAAGLIGGAFNPILNQFSDRRLKTNVQRIGTHPLGIGIYSFNYLWGEPGVGVMADELEPIMPDAVSVHPSGFKMVDYGRI